MKKLALCFLAVMMTAAAGAVLAAEYVVEIRDNKFLPASLQIKTGDAVRWVNQEKRTSHSVLFKQPTVFESERMFPGESWLYRFDKPGKIDYSCGPHPEMFGTIEVIE